MEKYGVLQDSATAAAKNKTASENATACRACGETLQPRELTGVYKCPRCGTKPYEEKK